MPLFGMDMATPPKIPTVENPPARAPSPLMWVGIIAIGCATAAVLLPPLLPPAPPSEVAKSEPALTPADAGAVCLLLSENPKEYLSSEEMQRRTERRRTACDMAFAAAPYDLTLKVKMALAKPYEQRAEKLAILREAASQGSPEAYYQIYESHKSWDRGDLDKTPLVPRAEADHALRMAAQLGHPFSTQMLAVLLDRGTTVKRDPAAARYWAERAVNNPAQDATRGGLLELLARLLVTSDKPEERARGLDLLERLSKAGVFGAKADLAEAIRKEDPVRARALLEEARRPDPGGAIPPLAEMLMSGEGGPADPKRALSLLKSTRTSRAEAALGRLHLEGKLVPHDVQEAARRLFLGSAWDVDVQRELLQMLAGNPEARLDYPNRLLYFAMEAAELDEPGALTALINLKLSDNAQFKDKAGACKLIETAVSRGDQAMAARLPECRGG
jgi:TPR repeat protein